MTYTSIDTAVKLVQSMGQGTLLTKMDMKDAYRLVPVHPTDCLLAVQWQSTTFIDWALLFGLWSAPKLLSAIADGLLWIILKERIQLAIHYLDSSSHQVSQHAT